MERLVASLCELRQCIGMHSIWMLTVRALPENVTGLVAFEAIYMDPKDPPVGVDNQSASSESQNWFDWVKTLTNQDLNFNF